MNTFLIYLPRWIFLGILLATPWVFYGRSIWMEAPWAKLILLTAGSYLLIGLVRRKLAFPSLFFLLPALYLLLQGWFMTWNARYDFFPAKMSFIPFHQALFGYPGTVFFTDSVREMWKISGLIAVMWMASSMAVDKTWRRRIIDTLLLSGALIAGFGLLARMQGPSGIYPDVDRNSYPFATFYYHGNAAAFLNTALPLGLVFFLRTLVVHASDWKRAAYLSAAVLLLVGTLVCASKAGLVVSVLLIISVVGCFLVFFKWKWSTESFHLPPYFFWGFLALLVIGLVMFVGQEATISRWQYAFAIGGEIMAGRAQTAEICLKTLDEAGWFGFGPGTFAAVFPFAARNQGVTLDGLWMSAHQDYLQTVMEWGKCGALSWSILFFGAIVSAVYYPELWRRLRRHDRLITAGLILCLLGVAVHSFVDFPLQMIVIRIQIAAIVGLLWSSGSWRAKKIE